MNDKKLRKLCHDLFESLVQGLIQLGLVNFCPRVILHLHCDAEKIRSRTRCVICFDATHVPRQKIQKVKQTSLHFDGKVRDDRRLASELGGKFLLMRSLND